MVFTYLTSAVCDVWSVSSEDDGEREDGHSKASLSLLFIS